MARTSPIAIVGNWSHGSALDVHTVSSTLLGENSQGRKQFDTKRSELGELIYRLKYGGDRSAANEITRTVATFVRTFRDKFDVIVPVPPSASREFQPILILAKGLSEAVAKPMSNCVVPTRTTTQLKDVSDPVEREKLLKGLYAVKSKDVSGKNVLVLDDLYRSGSTLKAVTQVLLDEGGAASVRVLAITYTRSRK